MLIQRLKNLSIGYKIYIPTIFTILIGLGIVILNAFGELETIEKKSRSDVISQMQLYVEQGLKEKKQIGLTNAINLALNKSLIHALKHGDRDTAYNYLRQLSDQFASTDYKDIKIHIHDKNVRSFVRHWKPDEFGDDLTSFRDSLNLVKVNKNPIAVIEPGRAGMLLRGVAPILDGDTYIGSVEFIQEFDNLVLEARRANDYSLIVLTYPSERFRRFDTGTPRAGAMYLSQRFNSTNPELFQALSGFDYSAIRERGYTLLAGYFISSIPLYDIRNEEVGTVLVALPQKRVDGYVEQAKASLMSQIRIMTIVAMSVALLLVFMLHYAIQHPIKHLHNRLVAIKDGLVGGENLGRLNRLRIKVDREDEIGAMSRIINRMLRNLVHEFIKVQKASKTTMEYINAVNEGSIVSKSDINGIITYVNKALCETTGYSEAELIGQPHNIFRHPNTPKRTFKVMWNTIQSGEVWHGLLKNRRKDGSTFYANVTVVPIKDSRNRIVEYVALRDDVTELVNAKEELKRMFLTDPLTSFGNRFKMLDTIESRPYSHLAIIDIHDFKEINDFYGHMIGDKVIVQLANILFDYFCDASTEVFHLSADEFAVLSDADAVSFGLFSERVESFFSEFNHINITVEEQVIPLQLTSGIAESSEHLVNYADIAHQHAKKSNRNIVTYSEAISTDQEYQKNLEWTAKIKEAIEEERIHAYYQPIYNNRTRRIEKYETLMRLVDSDGYVIEPKHFLEIAKKTRHYPELTRIIVQQAFREFEHSDYEFSVNLSAEDIILHNIGHYFFDLAKEYGVEKRVVIELVESEGIESFDTVETFIQRAKSYGMKIAIDDFGTGYSNFEYLIRLNTDYLKIDGSLIRTLDSDERLRSVVETMVSFAQKNGIKTIAEFVATAPLQQSVEQLKIDYSQGYYHGKPSPKIL